MARFESTQGVKCSIRFEDLGDDRWFIEKVIELLKSLFGGGFRKAFEGLCRATTTFEKTLEKPRDPCPRFSNARGLAWWEWPRLKFRDLIFHRSRHAIILFVIPRPGMADGQTWNARNYAPSLSLSLRPYLRWKMFYDQTLGSPFKQHIVNPTAESSDDRTWQNIVAKPSSCISVSPPPLLSLQLIYRDRRVKIGEGQMFPDVCR